MRRILLCYWLSLLTSIPAHAVTFQPVINDAHVILQNGLYVLHADIDYPLSPSAKEALLKGIILSWNIPIHVKEHRSLLWNKEVYSNELHYQIRYYALLNIYRVKTDHQSQPSNFSSLSNALNSIATLTIPLLPETDLSKTKSYQAEFRIVFNRNALPIPLRPLTYFDSNWYLSSEWFICSLPK